MTESRATAEWDWICYGAGARLHAPKVWDDPDHNAYDNEGETECGLRGFCCIPGIFSRMGEPRCARCCRITGFPPGVGSPKNDDKLRPLVGERLIALGLETAESFAAGEERLRRRREVIA